MNIKQSLAAFLAVGLMVGAPFSYADSKPAPIKAQLVTQAAKATADYTLSGKYLSLKDNLLHFQDENGMKLPLIAFFATEIDPKLIVKPKREPKFLRVRTITISMGN